MMTPEQLTVDLKSVLKENLVSAVLFGSGAVGDRTRNYSDYNLLLLLKEMNMEVLKASLHVLKPWIRDGNPAPVFFSVKRFEEAQDVFPIEFLDMKESHRILWGADPFRVIQIKDTDLRAQLEYELRSKLMTLQQKYLETGGDPKRLRDLLARSLSAFTVLFKSVLRLAGKPVPEKKHDVWKAAAAQMPIDQDALDVIYRFRNKDKEALKHDPEDLMSRLMRSVRAAIDYVDAFRVIEKK